MADLGEIWGRIPDRETMRVETPIGSIRRLGGLSQQMVSGDIAAAAARRGVDAVGVGANGLASGDAYSVRLARDRMLIVSGDDAPLEPGWNDEGYAVTNMCALDVFEIDGALADEIVSRATTLPVSGAGPSAAVTFAGLGAYLYRHGHGAAIRVHVDGSLTPHIWNWFETALPMILQSRARPLP